MWELEEEEEVAEEDGKPADVLLPEADRVFEVSAEEEAVMRVVENKRRLRDSEEIKMITSKRQKGNEKMQAKTENPEINKEEWKHNSTVWLSQNDQYIILLLS